MCYLGYWGESYGCPRDSPTHQTLHMYLPTYVLLAHTSWSSLHRWSCDLTTLPLSFAWSENKTAVPFQRCSQYLSGFLPSRVNILSPHQLKSHSRSLWPSYSLTKTSNSLSFQPLSAPTTRFWWILQLRRKTSGLTLLSPLLARFQPKSWFQPRVWTRSSPPLAMSLPPLSREGHFHLWSNKLLLLSTASNSKTSLIARSCTLKKMCPWLSAMLILQIGTTTHTWWKYSSATRPSLTRMASPAESRKS